MIFLEDLESFAVSQKCVFALLIKRIEKVPEKINLVLFNDEKKLFQVLVKVII